MLKPQTFVAGKQSKLHMYGAFACGVNVYLNAHKDQDFLYSAVTIHMKLEEYTFQHAIVAYFCFPRLGVAVPLRPGDILIFDPCEPHCVSSRCRHDDNIYCLSLYLKTANVGLNDNSYPLTNKQEKLACSYQKINSK